MSTALDGTVMKKTFSVRRRSFFSPPVLRQHKNPPAIRRRLRHTQAKHELALQHPTAHPSTMKKNSMLAARIRRVMLADEEVGKIAATVPGLIGELFAI